MASVTTSLALGAKQAVRGAKLAGKRTAAPKAVNVTAKAQISKGTRPPSFARRFEAAKTSISILPALPACSSFRPSRTRDDADPDPHPSRVAVDKAAAVAAASTLAVTPAARASELGEVRSFFHHGNRQPLGGGTRAISSVFRILRDRAAPASRNGGGRVFSFHPGRRFATATAVDPSPRAC